MSSFDVLVTVSAALGVAWALLAVLLIGDRTHHDRVRDQAARDTEALAARTVQAAQLPRRRLRRVALGPRCDAAIVAACELDRRDGQRLRLTATTGSRSARVRALAILVRGRDSAASVLVREAFEHGDPTSTVALLRLAGELPIDEADDLLLDVLVAGRLPRSRTATELEPRTGRVRRRLIELTGDAEPEVRYWAITLLKPELEHGPAAKAVLAHVTDESPNVRAAVAEALGFAPLDTAAPLLRRLLADDVFFVRSHAARAVAQGGRDELAGELLPLLADLNWWVRAAAKESLTALGEAGLQVALAARSHPDRFARDGALEIIAASGHPLDLSDPIPELAVA